MPSSGPVAVHEILILVIKQIQCGWRHDKKLFKALSRSAAGYGIESGSDPSVHLVSAQRVWPT